ncbi:IS3 family transposase [Oceanispirochaeta crateris]|uniref:IS3 family transposase n=1 Tax=Oceanispirochaeta crateris TaxID=2518645 RepID=A0A5C1QR22_9SPIO|nr:IS3 family transposase [Oceanispirochaeta crateris]
MRPGVKREAVKHIVKYFGLSIRRACRLVQIPRSTYLYDLKPNDDGEIIKEIYKILKNNSKYGCGMIHLKLRQNSIAINHKRTERIYNELGLQLKSRKRRKKISSENREPAIIPKTPGKLWAIDFVSDSVGNHKKLKVLTVIDPTTNRSPIIHAGFSINGRHVSEILDRAGEKHGYPETLQCDNGPEFRSKELDKWCYEKGIKISFSRPGKPTDNCYIESFNGTFRNECLNSHYFESITDAREKIEDWWSEYNYERPQKRLKGMTPIEFESKLKKLKTKSVVG